ncbi:MAG: polymer-forming cytoskeletal protein [Burkholderiales bacterium]
MLKLNRRDGIADPADHANTVLKPAIYDPPGAGNPGGGASSRGTPAAPDMGARTTPMPPAPAPKDMPESKLFVGVNIKLKGVEITDCDALVIEGQVEATVHSKAMEIARPGTLKGTAQIEVAEIHGEFVGELTARTRLIVHGTGRVSGTIRYGKLVIEEGGEITGDVKRLESPEGSTAATSAAGASAPQAARAPLSPSAERWSN